MATNSNWDKLVGAKTLTDGGYVSDLMTVARAHVADAIKKNEITQAQAGEVYTALLPSAMQNALEFLMRKM